jgi:acyl dehydratase
MALNLDTVGVPSRTYDFPYTWRDVALYALSLGAGPEDLTLVVERDPPVLPTFPVLPAFQPVFDMLSALGVDLGRVLHTAQRTELFAPLPSQGTLATTALVRGVYDMRIGALIEIETTSAIGDRPCARTLWSLLALGVGGVDGGRAPASLRTRPPKDAVPDLSHEWLTSPSQALLYRLNGDINPIHAFPDAAQAAGLGEPILHGLCTYGYLARVALRSFAGNDPTKFRAFEARFSKPVLPGQTLVADAYRLASGSLALTARIKETGELAVANAQLDFVE